MGEGTSRDAVDPVKVRDTLRDLAARYPEPLRGEQTRDVERIAFQVECIYRPGASVVDLGGGIGLFPLACAALGMETWLVDDFGEPVNREFSLDALGLHARLGVHVVQSPVASWARSFAKESIDVVTSFDSLEHWHHTPRSVLEQAHRVLRPSGVLFLSGPNAVNLRKRLAVLAGRSNWSRFEDWFYPEVFRGHVREPILAELERMVRETGFQVERTWGRNWAAYLNVGDRPLVRWVDRLLRPFPTLCSDLYVRAIKQARPESIQSDESA